MENKVYEIKDSNGKIIHTIITCDNLTLKERKSGDMILLFETYSGEANGFDSRLQTMDGHRLMAAIQIGKYAVPPSYIGNCLLLADVANAEWQLIDHPSNSTGKLLILKGS